VSGLCAGVGMTCQNFYKHRRVRGRLAVDEQLVLDLVLRERFRQPCLGGRKLMHLVGGDLASAGVSMGRDRFFALLARQNLLVPRPSRRARTTQSGHGYRYYPNLAKTLILSGPHQLLVSDITYIRTLDGFMYLCLVMDSFSRTIVGFDSSDSLEMEGTNRALKMALKQLPVGATAMHHSDRGVQYCCGPYIKQLNKAGVSISMTEQNHCYENSHAERLNGTLKREYALGTTFAKKAQVRPAVREAVWLYNECRPHQALGFQMPMSVHQGAVIPLEM